MCPCVPVGSIAMGADQSLIAMGSIATGSEWSGMEKEMALCRR